MKRMWSTWRSQYIESFKDKSEKKGCVFCEAAKEKPSDERSLVIAKGEKVFALLNLYPYNNGHLMVAPYRHTSEFESLASDEFDEARRMLQNAHRALKEIANPQGFNMGLNIGEVGGAGVRDHLHFHLVPRWAGDTNFMPVVGEVKVISQDLLATKRKLLERWEP